jgi:hypothetical protein
VDKDGETLKTEEVEHGKAATAPEAPEVEGYTFTGWDKKFNNVTSDLTVTALYEAIPDFTPQNLSVTLEEHDNDLRIILAWEKVEGAVSYDLRMVVGENELFTQNTMGLNTITALLSQLEQQYQLTPGTYLIDWFVRSTDDKGQAISDWAQGESFEITIEEPAQGMDDVQSAEPIRKEMRNGLLYIIRNDKTYNSTGKLIE